MQWDQLGSTTFPRIPFSVWFLWEWAPRETLCEMLRAEVKQWSYCFSAQKIEAGATGAVTLSYGFCLLSGWLCWQVAEAQPSLVVSFPRLFSFFDFEARWMLLNSMTKDPSLSCRTPTSSKLEVVKNGHRFSVCSCRFQLVFIGSSMFTPHYFMYLPFPLVCSEDITKV